MFNHSIRANLAVLVGGLGLLLGWAVVPVSAHHSVVAEYNLNKPVTFKGTVTKLEWTNPHTWIHVDVKKADGTVENWAIEASAPYALSRRGFTKDSLRPGTEVVIDGYQAKDGARRVTVDYPYARLLFEEVVSVRTDNGLAH